MRGFVLQQREEEDVDKELLQDGSDEGPLRGSTQSSERKKAQQRRKDAIQQVRRGR